MIEEKKSGEFWGNRVFIQNHNLTIDICSSDESTENLNSRAISLFLFLTDDDCKRLIRDLYFEKQSEDLLRMKNK